MKVFQRQSQTFGSVFDGLETLGVAADLVAV